MLLSYQQQRGHGLVEILVSLGILSFGLLSLGLLQNRSINNNYDSYLHNIAINQVYSIAERMRANIVGVNAGSYDAASGIPNKIKCTTCTSSEIATNDIYNWNTQNQDLLPTGQGKVTKSGDLYLVVVMWDNDRTGAKGTNCSGNSKVDLTCFEMTIRIR